MSFINASVLEAAVSATHKHAAARFEFARPAMEHAPPTTLETMFREHHALVYRTAYRITGSRTDAEDVLQTIFLRLMQSSEKSDARDLSAGAEAYLCRAAINAALDLMRSRGRASFVAFDDADEAQWLKDSNLSPEARHESIEMRNVIRRTLADMSARTAEVFALRYFEGYGNAEIARALDMSPLVVGVQLHRARVRLQNELKKFLES